jgi:peptidoglycan/xylan/chitin deacetylase (PgdA/CDA1 family)
MSEKISSLKKVLILFSLMILFMACNESANKPIEDTVKPVIVLNGTSNIILTVGERYSDAGATANDNKDGDITSSIVTINPVDTSKVGTYTITYNVKDAANNEAVEVIRTVKVVESADVTPPVITLVGEAVVEVKKDSTYTDAGATANDNKDGDITSSIVTVNPVDTSKVGTYTITYNVKDRANNKALEVRRTVNVKEVGSNIATYYEDAENQKTDKWKILSNDSGKAQITNTYDDEKNSRVIYLDAKIKDNNRKSYDTFKFNGIDNNQSNQYIQWSMKFNQTFIISIYVTTQKGKRWIQYIAKDTGLGIHGKYIVHGIGSNKTNDEWHTIIRDLDRDLKRYEPDNNFKNIDYMTVRGGGYIDDIKSYKTEDGLEVNKPVVVSQAGVVLTFDDSYIENWNEMQTIFKEKGAVATFFCNRWASQQDWNLPPAQISLLKKFRDNGDEIAFHTRDHVNTRDKRYANKENKAQAYLDDQITLGVEYMKNEGFNPTSFSYPFMSGTPAHNKLIRQELPHIREFFAHVTLIDDPGEISLDEIRVHLEKLKKDKDIGVFLSHWILDENSLNYTEEEKKYKYRIPKEKLISIMDMVNELGLEFYTLEEAHNIYMNQ